MKRFFCALALVMASALSASAQGPEDIVRWIYASLSDTTPASQQGLFFLSSPAQRGSYFTRRMVAFYDANDSYGDNLAEACVDFGFAIPGNDYDAAEIARTLQVESQTTPDRISVVARFSSFGTPAAVQYDFVQEGGFWKIDDIAGEGFRVSQIPCAPKAATVVPTQANGFCYRNGGDSLRLDVFDSGAARLEVSSWQGNGHSCGGVMTGRETEGGWDFPGAEGCRLQVRVTPESGLQFADPDWSCKASMCGQRAVLDGLVFPRSSQVGCAQWQSDIN